MLPAGEIWSVVTESPKLRTTAAPLMGWTGGTSRSWEGGGGGTGDRSVVKWVHVTLITMNDNVFFSGGKDRTGEGGRRKGLLTIMISFKQNLHLKKYFISFPIHFFLKVGMVNYTNLSNALDRAMVTFTCITMT